MFLCVAIFFTPRAVVNNNYCPLRFSSHSLNSTKQDLQLQPYCCSLFGYENSNVLHQFYNQNQDSIKAIAKINVIALKDNKINSTKITLFAKNSSMLLVPRFMTQIIS